MRGPLLLISILLFAIQLYAQEPESIRPGILYQSGREIVSAKYGLAGTIPEGWSGMLPRETETFLFTKNDGTDGQAYLFGRENTSIEELKEGWKNGLQLTPALYLKAADDIHTEGQMAYVEVMAEGKQVNRTYQGFLIGRCGEYGNCLTLFLVTPERYFETLRSEMISFVQSIHFEKPGNTTPYHAFNWKEFLGNKMLVTYEVEGNAKRQNEIHLCADGTFVSEVKQTSWLKEQNKDYLGKNKGTWTVTGTGPQSTLSLSFQKNIPAIQFSLLIEDEKIFANGIRYYAGFSEKCE